MGENVQKQATKIRKNVAVKKERSARDDEGAEDKKERKVSLK